MGRFRLSLSTTPIPAPGISVALGVPAAKRTDPQKQQVRDFYRAQISREFKPLNDAIASSKKAADDFDSSLTKVPVMDDAVPRETHVLENTSDSEAAEYVVARDSPTEDAVVVPWAEEDG